MNQTMTKNPPAPAKNSLPVMPADDHEMTGTERVVESLGPHFPKIGIAVAVGLLVLIGVTLLIKSQQQSRSMPWNELAKARNEFVFSQNSDSLTRVAAEYPNSPAGMWGLQLAGDVELRNGIGQLASDREGGRKAVEKAADLFQQIVDSPDSAKSPMIQQRSLFSLAYARETLGEFDAAAKLYEQLAEAAPDSSFADAAERGARRASNPAYAAVYEKFVNWEDVEGEAPGPNVPDRPDISFPEFENLGAEEDSSAEAGEPAAEQDVDADAAESAE